MSTKSLSSPLPVDALGWVIFAWGIGGVLLILLQAVVRLTPMALAVFDGTLTAVHWVAVVLWSAFMIYSEAWRGFHLRFSPRAVVRSLALAREKPPLLALLAPLVAMGLLYATRRRLIASYVLLIMIVAVVVAVRMLPHPWRGIVDVGVVLGLLGGALSLLFHTILALTGRPPQVAPEFPDRR
jgi:hypothetical protein